MKNIAIIPARSGSKGLKDKNIKLLNGKPLIWYSIQAAINSNCFDEVMVSTDSYEYAQVAKECGASVPFYRSEATSTDQASSWDVVEEVLEIYKKQGKEFDTVMLLQPTSPLRTTEDIKNAFSVMNDKNANSVVSVCQMEHSPLWSNILPEDGNLREFISPEIRNIVGRQGLPTYYRINGAIYLERVSEHIGDNVFSENSYAYVMPQEKSIDIDTEVDFRLAEYWMNTIQE